MGRRSFLQQAGFGIGVLVAASTPYGLLRIMTPVVKADPRSRLRPPGALKDDAAFNEACIGCGLCGEVCPPRCISFYRREGGARHNTPYINPEEKACILCGKCMEACPTEALIETPREEVDMGIAQIDRSACYPWVDRGICGACVSICPLGDRAISFKMWNQYQPIVKQGCVGCGMCVEACPHPSLPIWIVERSEGTVAPHRI
jgi:formate hydrogenlyase subunit 6/NADH:ubiquinone oxidoreductase subunit I